MIIDKVLSNIDCLYINILKVLVSESPQSTQVSRTIRPSIKV